MSLATTVYLEIENDIKIGHYDYLIEINMKAHPEYTADGDNQFIRNGVVNTLKHDLFEKEYHERATKLFAECIDTLNASCKSNTEKAFMESLTKTHRYIQGEFWMFIKNLADKYSQLPDMYFDPRNEFAKGMCERMVKGANNF